MKPQQENKATEKQPKSKIKEVAKAVKEWIEWNVSPIVALSITAFLVSIASATLTISTLIRYLTTH